MRTVLNSENQGRTRSDLLFTMSNNTRTTRQSLGGAKSFHLWTSETGCCERGVPFLGTHSLSGHRGDKRFAPEAEQKRMPTEASKPPASCAPNNKASQSSRPSDRAGSCWIVIAGLVEPDGIEPTTSCLQSRRSPN